MTLGEFKAAIRLRLRESGPDAGEGSGAGDPFTLEQYIRDAADEVAFRTDALYGTRTTSLQAGRAGYCLPLFYKVKAVRVKDAGGIWHSLGIVDSPGRMDRRAGTGWRNGATADLPTVAVFSGPDAVTLSPTPAAAVTGGLAFEGFYKPGAFWRYDAETGGGIPIADTDECPLPVWAHEAVLRCALYKRAADDDRPEIARRVGRYKAEYDGPGGEVKNVEAAAALYQARLLSERGAAR